MEAILTTFPLHSDDKVKTEHLISGQPVKIRGKQLVTVELFNKSGEFGKEATHDGVSVTIGDELRFCYPYLGKETTYQFNEKGQTYRVQVIDNP